MEPSPMDIERRIAQFENMCQADPENDMAHFSLGGAYAQAGRHADAAGSFLRCVELNPAMSKAYQLAAESLLKAGQAQKAAEVATEGYEAAASRGDLLPKKALGAILESLGKPLPEVDESNAPEATAGGFVCQRTGRPGSKLNRPPMKGPIGQWIFENISAETWRMWIGQGTKVINELRLDFSREEDQETYDRHMRDFLGIDDKVLAEIGAKA
jgi:Fe-S cluster biosynthesis and repair protein YggX